MTAVDTNILVYAHREDSPFHDAASKRIAELAEGSATWSISWPCIHLEALCARLDEPGDDERAGAKVRATGDEGTQTGSAGLRPPPPSRPKRA